LFLRGLSALGALPSYSETNQGSLVAFFDPITRLSITLRSDVSHGYLIFFPSIWCPFYLKINNII
jgi:hypothetical protein